MHLVQSYTTKGLWLHPDNITTGAHALVIGISDYPHLDGMSDVGRMTKLEVSAKTAAKIFDWLRRRGSVAGAPLASCRLLLAPVPGEKAEVDALTDSYYADCDFTTFRAAVEAWSNDLFASGKSDTATVAFFFFSGHGMEYLAQPCMLAKDIMDPRIPNRGSRALAFHSLLQAVSTYGMDRGLFFIDACRNAQDVTRRLNIVGAKVIDPDPEISKVPEAVVWLQATRAGDRAYQVPEAPATIFGQALIDALEGLPPDYLPYDRNAWPWRLEFGELESHVKGRVQELISSHTATESQAVQSGGSPYNHSLMVAEMEPLVNVRTLPDQEEGLYFRLPHPFDMSQSMRKPENAGELVNHRSQTIQKLFNKADLRALASDRQVKGLAAPPRAGDLGRASVMREVFGSEAITDHWLRSLRVVDLDSGDNAGKAIQVYAGQHHRLGERLTCWVDLVVVPGAGKAVWLEIDGFSNDHGFAVVIPRDERVATPIRLDLRFAGARGNVISLVAVSARIGSICGEEDDPDTPDDETKKVWGPLWAFQRTELLSQLGEAGAQADDLAITEATLLLKTTPPLAAAVGGAQLLRAGALEKLHDWSRKLADWFPWLPEGPILWAETLLRRDERASSGKPRYDLKRPAQAEALAFFLKIAERGPPLLTPVLQMAARQSTHWRDFRDAIGTHPGGIETTERFERACAAIDAATASATSDGLFLTFIDSDIKSLRKSIAKTRRPTAAAAT